MLILKLDNIITFPSQFTVSCSNVAFKCLSLCDDSVLHCILFLLTKESFSKTSKKLANNCLHSQSSPNYKKNKYLNLSEKSGEKKSVGKNLNISGHPLCTWKGITRADLSRSLSLSSWDQDECGKEDTLMMITWRCTTVQ